MKNFLIYKSSAGSGKTYTLVKEYLKIVLENPDDFRRTLAITFTNKAAEEMKSRIIEKLKKLASGSDKELEKTLIDEGVKSNIRENAQTVLDNILHKYTYFSVSTIDSFFHRVIRSFARELKLQFGYEVVLDEDEVLDKAVDDVFTEIGIDKELTRYLEDYVYFNIDEDKSWNIDKEIKNLAGEIFKERYIEKRNSGSSPEDVKLKIKDLFGFLFAVINSFENTMKDFGKEAADLIQKHGLNAEDFNYSSGGAAGYLIKLSRQQTYDYGSCEPAIRARSTSEGTLSWYKKGSVKQQAIERCVKEGLGKILSDVIKYYDGNSKLYYTSREILRTIFVIGIFNDIHKKLNLYRDENKAMLISDTNILLSSVIGSAYNPFIYEKIGSYYKHFLIDEFQDTSTFQWKNLLPLIANSLSEQNISMVVGDVKQSIYRWRNGNMKLLLADIYDNLSSHREQFNEEKLLVNRRSKQDIINFNNHFFTSAPKILELKAEGGNAKFITEAYKEVLQTQFKPGSGFTDIEFITGNKEEKISAADIADKRLMEIMMELQANKVYEGDILILTRKRKEASRAARLLINAGINVVSDESLLLHNSPKVKLILSLFRYFISPDDIITNAGILRNAMLVINSNQHVSAEFFNSELVKENVNNLLRQRFGNKVASPANVSLYELTENIIKAFGLNSVPDAYLLRFQDAVLEYSAQSGNSIVNFLDWWETKQKDISIITPRSNDAVRIMTIHKAKGLQSPVVIIPYANWDLDIDGKKDFFWVTSRETPYEKYSPAYYVRASAELAKTYFSRQYYEEAIAVNIDNLNLLYVAFTRASERLYVLCPQRGNTSLETDKIGKSINEHRRINTAQLIKYIIATDKRLNRYYDETKDVFKFGAKTKIEGGKPAEQVITVKDYISSDWFRKLIVKS